jgi:hypothetical protein
VLDLIKYLEFMDDQRPSDAQEGGMDPDRIRRELRLSPE